MSEPSSTRSTLLAAMAARNACCPVGALPRHPCACRIRTRCFDAGQEPELSGPFTHIVEAKMRFMSMVKSREDCGAAPQSLMDAMAVASVEAMQDGSIVTMGGLAPTAMSRKVRLAGGRISIVDGPFAEAKEVVGGYAVLEASSREAAVDQAVWLMNLHLEHWPGWEGEVEVRQIFGSEDFPQAAPGVAAT